jgi:hypothetical protein
LKIQCWISDQNFGQKIQCWIFAQNFGQKIQCWIFAQDFGLKIPNLISAQNFGQKIQCWIFAQNFGLKIPNLISTEKFGQKILCRISTEKFVPEITMKKNMVKQNTLYSNWQSESNFQPTAAHTRTRAHTLGLGIPHLYLYEKYTPCLGHQNTAVFVCLVASSTEVSSLSSSLPASIYFVSQTRVCLQSRAGKPVSLK